VWLSTLASGVSISKGGEILQPKGKQLHFRAKASGYKSLPVDTMHWILG
jgi:hypothetical protein